MVRYTGEEDGFCVLAVAGALDLRGVDRFRAAVKEALDTGHVRLLLDLGAAGPMGSSGLGALLWAAPSTRRAGGDPRLANASQEMAALLRRAGVTRTVPTADPPEHG